MKFAGIYAKARGSKWFLIGLLSFIGTWLSFHFTVGFDKDFGMLNLFLSSEASIGLAFFTMLSDQQTHEAKAQTLVIQQILEAIQAQDKKVLEIVEDIQEELDAN